MVKAVCRLVKRRSVAKDNGENEACITSSFAEWIDQSKAWLIDGDMPVQKELLTIHTCHDYHLQEMLGQEPVGTAGAALVSAAWATQNFCGNFTESK